MAGAEGLEPSTKVLETHVLPLHHAPTERFESIHDLSRFVNRKIQTSVFCAVGLSNILDSEGREDVSGSGPMKRTHGTGVAPTLVGS